MKLTPTSLVRARVARILLAFVALALTLAAVPSGRAEDVGLSTERLHRINQVVQRYIDAKEIAGAVTVVSRRGRVAHFEAQGLMDIERTAPMRKDGIFRMASMTKPVIGVAIMIMLEEGKVRLSDPVSKFIPEFKNAKVAIEIPPTGGRGAAALGEGPPAPPEIYTVPATRDITVRDLATHTSGLVSGGAGTREANRIAPRDTSSNLAAHMPKLALAPLDFQPGSQWRYSGLAGIDTLGRIVEVASGQTLDVFLKQRIFDPLGMKDTAFFPTDDRMARVVTLYGRTPNGLKKTDAPAWLLSKTYFSGGGGLWSTAEDYLQFAQMLVNGGELNGKRLLSPRTIALMASNHVGDLYSQSGTSDPLERLIGRRRGMGFGLTVEVVMNPIEANRRQSAGSFGWDGAFGTHFWVDPKEQLTGILLIQQGLNAALNRDFENAVMQAIID
ncbi:MAG TPA: serine hydrolase domain-containing protein [Vicinamibacterales bacterium]|nr:serine hydrolase domain-containing protein [Vicinamibacterales bacterium]